METKELVARLIRVRDWGLVTPKEREALNEAIGIVQRYGDEKGPVARVLTAEEVETAPAGTTLWEESLDGYDGTTSLHMVWVDDAGRIGDMECWLKRTDVRGAMRRDEEGCALRWWNWLPTREQMQAEAWPERQGGGNA